jgi:hypothetical protein
MDLQEVGMDYKVNLLTRIYIKYIIPVRLSKRRLKVFENRVLRRVFGPRWIFRKLEGVMGTGWTWLRIGTDGGHLWVR